MLPSQCLSFYNFERHLKDMVLWNYNSPLSSLILILVVFGRYTVLKFVSAFIVIMRDSNGNKYYG